MKTMWAGCNGLVLSLRQDRPARDLCSHLHLSARCLVRRATSPLQVGDEVKVVGMPSEAECEHNMLVTIRWKRRELAVPLSQLEGIQVDEQTQQALEDWHYWVNRGYEL